MKRTTRTAALVTVLGASSLPAALALAAPHRPPAAPPRAAALLALAQQRSVLATLAGGCRLPAPAPASGGATGAGGPANADLLRSFGVLRRPRTAADALTPQAEDALLAQGLAVDPGRARLLRATRSGGKAWVVPVPRLPEGCGSALASLPAVRGALVPSRSALERLRAAPRRPLPAPPVGEIPRPPANQLLPRGHPTVLAPLPPVPRGSRVVPAQPRGSSDRVFPTPVPRGSRVAPAPPLPLVPGGGGQLPDPAAAVAPLPPGARVRLDPRTGRLLSARLPAPGPGLAVVATGDAAAGGGGTGAALVRGLAPALVEPCSGAGGQLLAISGIVPDGVPFVDLARADGTAVRADVTDNGYAFALPASHDPEPTYVVWTGGDGTPHVEPVPGAAPLKSLRCTARRGPTGAPEPRVSPSLLPRSPGPFARP